MSILSRCVLALCVVGAIGSATVGGSTDPKQPSREAACDLPGGQQLRNVGGSDGAGLCVFTSIDHAARWQSVPELQGFRDWMRKHPGGGYPEKVDRMIAAKAPGFKGYVQAVGPDAVPLLEWAMRTGRMACITYGFSERYGQRVDHMVNAVHLDSERAAVLDNNFPGSFEWMDRGELLARMSSCRGSRSGRCEPWVFVLTAPPPPPVPMKG